LLSYDADSNVWQVAIPRFSAAMPANVAASADYVVVPCYEPGGWSSMDTNFGGVFVYDIRQKTYRRVTNTDGLPNDRLYSAAIDGSKVWVGGAGFVALLDMPTGRVEKVFRLASALRVLSAQLAGDYLWFSSGPGLYRLPRNANAEPALAVPASTASSAAAAKEITDIESARELLKKRAEVYRTYGTAETAEYREMTARFRAFVRRAAGDFPSIESPSRSGTNHFREMIMNKNGRGYDGFRFRSTLQEPADFGWIFAYEQPTSFQWFILPVEDTTMVGFTDSFAPKVAYTNAPWTGLKEQFGVQLQFLHDGQLTHGKEYLLWFDFKTERPTRFFLAFDFFPAAARHRSRSVLEGTFGLGGTPITRPY
jgi:hypothetical protein